MTFFNFFIKAARTRASQKQKRRSGVFIAGDRRKKLKHSAFSMGTCLMYHAACKVEFQPFNRLYSQLTFFNFFIIKWVTSRRRLSFLCPLLVLYRYSVLVPSRGTCDIYLVVYTCTCQQNNTSCICSCAQLVVRARTVVVRTV